VIEAHGGFVDKYIGDAIVAVFGAPLDDPHHATNAVRAALRCAAALGTLDRVTAAFGATVRQRIGLNSGAALVGNIGSRRRFNYTVMGDVVNLASRLEGANKLYGTTVLASQATVALTGNALVWRELDAIRVKGRTEAVRVFEPLGVAGEVAADVAGARARLWRGAHALSRARLRRRRRAIRARCSRRSSVRALADTDATARARAAGPAVGAGHRPGGEIALTMRAARA
jgi:adenylate cyclase